MLPRFIRGAARGDEWLVCLAYLVLNAGVLTVGLRARFGGAGGDPARGAHW